LNFQNWIVTPQNIPFSFEKGMEQIYFDVTAPKKSRGNNG
jgi:hypothetical protein